MEGLTGLTGFDWVLLSLYASGLVFVAGAWWRAPHGTRRFGALVVPPLAAIGGVAYLVAAYHAETAHALAVLPDRTAAVAVTAMVLFGAIAVANFLLTSVATLVRRGAARLSKRHAADLALLAAVGVPTAAALGGISWADDRLTSSYDNARAVPDQRTTVLERYELPGQPMDVVFRTESRGYISFAEGQLAEFELPKTPGSELRIRAVTKGLRYPRGLAIVGDVLFAAELGRLPCPDPAPFCKGEHVPGVSVKDGERLILRSSRARILAFDIVGDGDLVRRRVVADRLPVANTDHGVNGIVDGPNGRLFVSIGHLDRLHASPELANDPSTPNGTLLGTVVELASDGSRLQVFARGLRNVYDLTFDDDGRLYGADNDGLTLRAHRLEEVLQIRRGAHYGYPYDGTFAPYTKRTDPPLWTMDTVGSAGIEWVDDYGRGPELIIGSCGKLQSLALSASPRDVLVAGPEALTHLMDVPGCVTAVERGPDHTIVITVFTFFDRRPQLYVLRVDG